MNDISIDTVCAHLKKSSKKTTKYEIRCYKYSCHKEDWTATTKNIKQLIRKIKIMAALGEINYVDIYDITSEDKWDDPALCAFDVGYLYRPELTKNDGFACAAENSAKLNYQHRIKILTKGKNRSWLECFSLLPESACQKIYEYIRYAGASGFHDRYLKRESKDYLNQITHLWDLCGIDAAVERIGKNYNFFLNINELKFNH